jgi:hypothetical protein
VILNGTSFKSFCAENAMSSAEFLERTKQIAANIDAHPPPSARAARSKSAADELYHAVKARLASRSPSRSHRNMMTATTATTATSDETFAKKLCEAVQSQLGSRSRQHNASAASSSDESFAEERKKAVETHSSGTMPTQKQHKERVERERARYHNRPRPHTKGE